MLTHAIYVYAYVSVCVCVCVCVCVYGDTYAVTNSLGLFILFIGTLSEVSAEVYLHLSLSLSAP